MTAHAAGTKQEALANNATKLICDQKVKHHSLILHTRQPNGSIRHTLFEMWPAIVRTLCCLLCSIACLAEKLQQPSKE